MSDKSGIEWTDATWNPTTGCDRVSPGCANCYALDLAARLKKMGAPAYQADGDPKTSGPGFALTLHPSRLDQPLRWTKPRRIFVNSMSDLFHPDVPDEFLDRIFAVMALAEHHTFQVLTKRPERMRAYMLDPIPSADTEPLTRADVVAFEMGRDEFRGLARGPMTRTGVVPWPLPNVWLGTSVENARWRTRIDELRETPATVRFLSCEPLLGPLSPLYRGAGPAVVGGLDLRGIGWVIAGGESGPNFRAVDLDWVRGIRDSCLDQAVPFLFKQVGGRTPKSGGRTLDGRTWDEYPA